MLDGLKRDAYGLYLVHHVFVVWLQYALLEAVLSAIVKGGIVFARSVVPRRSTYSGVGQSTKSPTMTCPAIVPTTELDKIVAAQPPRRLSAGAMPGPASWSAIAAMW